MDIFHERDMVCEGCFAKAPFLADCCERCGNPADSCECGEVRHLFSKNLSLFAYNDMVQKAVEKMKYNGKKCIAREFGRLIAKHTDLKKYAKGVNIIIPVPIHNKRKRERGFNQSGLIAAEISRSHGIFFDDGILIRTRNTESQFKLNRDERKQNVFGAFSVNADRDIRGFTILLADDIFTTGATLDECVKALIAAGSSEVFTVTAAKTVKWN